MTQPSMQDHIDYIMDNFDFEKVHKAMNALDWKWSSSNGIPEIYDLRRTARSLLKSAWVYGQNGAENPRTGTGGFWAEYGKHDDGSEWLELNFQITQWDSSEVESVLKVEE